MGCIGVTSSRGNHEIPTVIFAENQLLKDVDDARQARQNQEKIREELVRKAKQMQHKTTNRRNEGEKDHLIINYDFTFDKMC